MKIDPYLNFTEVSSKELENESLKDKFKLHQFTLMSIACLFCFSGNMSIYKDRKGVSLN